MTGGVFIDLVAAQSPSYRGRGIARYATELARAMARRHPGLVSGIVLHPELPPAEGLEDLSQWVTTEPDWDRASVLHLTSVFEPEVPARLFWPRQASASRLWLVATVYDLIPDVFPDWYLQDPGLRRRWRCGRELARVADAVTVPSEATKQDVVRRLGVPEDRVSVIGSGTSGRFRPPEPREAALATARRAVKGLRPGFIVYNGAFDPRKNVDRLLEAYASLPRQLIRKHQLVIFCHVAPLTRNHYLVMAERLGVKGRVLLPGFVPDDVMVALLQSAHLAVFPSLYEGYGLPVVDSLACGTPTIAGDNSSLREILPADARFDAWDSTAIANAMERALCDEGYRGYLLSLTRQAPPSWDAVADKLAAVYRHLMGRSRRYRPGWPSRPRLALVGAPTGLVSACQAEAEVDTWGTRAPLRRLAAWRGGYDGIVMWADGLPATAPEVVEELRADRPTPVIALVNEDQAPAGLALGSLNTLKVLRARGDWPDIARSVLGALR